MTTNGSESLRFTGLRPEAREFFRALEREPCPASWPGGDRVAYATHVLGPLKALTVDVAAALEGCTPALALMPRVGRSLAWPAEVAPDSADCPVRLVRAWPVQGAPESSPLLVFSLHPDTLQISLDSAGATEAPRRLRESVLAPSAEGRDLIESLTASGWRADGPPFADADDGSIPEAIRPWLRTDRLRVVRDLAWEDWLEEPGLATEVAECFAELLPLLHVVSEPTAVARTA